MILGSHKYFLYKALEITLGPLTDITHIIQLRFSTNNTYHITTKIGPQNYTISTKSPKSFYLWPKPKNTIY